MPTPIQQVNKVLAAVGRAERLVRSGKGYYYLTGGDAALLPQSGIYQYRLESAPATIREIQALFEAGGITINLEE